MESKIYEFINFSDFAGTKIGFLVGLMIYLIFLYKVKHSKDWFLMTFPILVFAAFLHFDAIKSCFNQPENGLAATGLANIFIGDDYWNIKEFTAFYKGTRIFFYTALFINGVGFLKRMVEAMGERKRQGKYYY